MMGASDVVYVEKRRVIVNFIFIFVGWFPSHAIKGSSSFSQCSLLIPLIMLRGLPVLNHRASLVQVSMRGIPSVTYPSPKILSSHHSQLFRTLHLLSPVLPPLWHQPHSFLNLNCRSVHNLSLCLRLGFTVTLFYPQLSDNDLIRC